MTIEKFALSFLVMSLWAVLFVAAGAAQMLAAFLDGALESYMAAVEKGGD